jgi:hypothetical protein
MTRQNRKKENLELELKQEYLDIFDKFLDDMADFKQLNDKDYDIIHNIFTKLGGQK